MKMLKLFLASTVAAVSVQGQLCGDATCCSSCCTQYVEVVPNRDLATCQNICEANSGCGSTNDVTACNAAKSFKDTSSLIFTDQDVSFCCTQAGLQFADAGSATDQEICFPTVVTDAPSHFPTPSPTDEPTRFPTKNPTNFPTKNPTKFPTPNPTQFPQTPSPTAFPTTKSPTNFPTKNPTNFPTKNPTKFPTKAPTNFPTKAPTKFPTKAPTKFPTTGNPTFFPTQFPTKSPTKFPTKNPTQFPTKSPTKFPTTGEPSVSPTSAPTGTKIPSSGSNGVTGIIGGVVGAFAIVGLVAFMVVSGRISFRRPVFTTPKTGGGGNDDEKQAKLEAKVLPEGAKPILFSGADLMAGKAQLAKEVEVVSPKAAVSTAIALPIASGTRKGPTPPATTPPLFASTSKNLVKKGPSPPSSLPPVVRKATEEEVTLDSFFTPGKVTQLEEAPEEKEMSLDDFVLKTPQTTASSPKGKGAFDVLSSNNFKKADKVENPIKLQSVENNPNDQNLRESARASGSYLDFVLQNPFRMSIFRPSSEYIENQKTKRKEKTAPKKATPPPSVTTKKPEQKLQKYELKDDEL